jgi:hypothetical protein
MDGRRALAHRGTVQWAAIRRSTWPALGAGAVLMIAPFLDWYSVSDGFEKVGGSVWDATDIAKVVFFLALCVLGVGAVDAQAPTARGLSLALVVAAAVALAGYLRRAEDASGHVAQSAEGPV